MKQFRVGEGWDTHALVPGRALVLGGITVPFEMGLWGHSDADVLVHAVIDALLGAAALGDIGRLFPDTDPHFKGARSIDLLQVAVQRLTAQGWAIGNIDCTIVAQSPKLAAWMPQMVDSLQGALGLAPGSVNIKAKTAEHLGPVGQHQSMEARAIALIWR